MKTKLEDLKYLSGLTVPVIGFMSIYYNGIFSYTLLVYAFLVVPAIESISRKFDKNSDYEEETRKSSTKIFDWLLYMNLPFQLVLLFFFLNIISNNHLTSWEIAGSISAMGICCGVIGINVAHELGHRHTFHERLMAKILLSTSLYMHFIIVHNRSHHKHVATPEDPATARYGENLYAFLFRSISNGTKEAWLLEKLRLQRLQRPWFSFHNEMLRFTLIQSVLVLSIFLLFGLTAGFSFITAALLGIILLETVNYIEHYGLEREKTPSGMYEPVKVYHSWNSDHLFGRIMLYELTRHSDHHHKTSRKYQVLRSHAESPQLPWGYPVAMLLAAFPPLWFAIMNKKIRQLPYGTRFSNSVAL